MPVIEAPEREQPQAAPSDKVDELHLLIGELDDELSAYRWREAIWISIIVHVVIILAGVTADKWMPWFPNWFPAKKAVILPEMKQETTFLELPPDQLHVKRPKTDIASDKNRVAQSRDPVPNPETLRKLLNAQRPGAPAQPSAPPAPAQQAQQVPQGGSQQPQENAQATTAQQQNTQTTAHLDPPPQPKGPSPFKTGMAPGAAVSQAIQGVASGHASTSSVSFSGDYGSSRIPHADTRGNVDIISDTMGVDFGPYLKRVVEEVRKNWYNLIPESARPPIMKKGNLSIEFAILKDGKIAGMKLSTPSGDIALDRAAWGGITDSVPFQALPQEFPGSYLALRFRFYYNPDAHEMQ